MTSEQYVIENTEKIWDIISRHLSEDSCVHTLPEVVQELFDEKESGVTTSNTESEIPQIRNWRTTVF